MYGLVVETDDDLHQDRPVEPGAVPDVVVRRGAETAQGSPLEGRVLLEHVSDGRRWYEAVEHDDGTTTLRFDGAAEFVVDVDGRHVEARPAVGSDPGVTTVLTGGGLLAFLLARRGELVLHASAVTHAGRAVAVVGFSGMGKSTCATLMCSAGASLVTDDVLVLRDGPRGEHLALPGATEVRLRKGADTLVQRFAEVEPTRRESADHRQVLGLAVEREPSPLGVVMIPVPDREARSIELERLAPATAAVDLMRFPRLSEWRDHGVSRRTFGGLARLVADVPVLVARVPWGPPFLPELGAELLAAVQAFDEGVGEPPAVTASVGTR